MTETDTSAGPDLTDIREAIEKSRRDVLDLSLRNQLLNFRPSRRRGVEVVDELSQELFRILVGKKRVMYFRPAPEGQESADRAGDPSADRSADTPDDVPAELLALLAEPAVDADGTAARHTDNKLQTALTLATLNLRLRETFRQARLSIEEQGVNILYLALGMLRWYESDTSTSERRAPLVLIPVRLVRSDVRENFKLRWTEDEIEANLSLEAKMKTEFGIRLPGMPAEEDLDVEEYLGAVERAVAKQQRWSVSRNEIRLNFFSFSKLLIYKDLDPASWPEGSRPADHPLMEQLFGSGGFAHDGSDLGEDPHIDEEGHTADLHPVVDADSSQALAVVDAINGRNLVIQGPPGTGKSQTITNLIGEALARDRKVLFVAEKMAALEVVKRRLDTIHLGDACLELHSHKTNKRAVLEELKRTLALGRPAVTGAAEDRVLLAESRKRLNEYSRAVNTPVAKSGLTPHELVGRLARLEAEGLAVEGGGLPVRGSVSWTAEEFIRRREQVRELQELVGRIGIPRDHVWWACGRLHFVPTDVHPVEELAGEASEALDRHRQDVDRLAGLLRSDAAPAELNPEGVERLVATVRRLLEAPDLAGANHGNPAWESGAERVLELAKTARRYAGVRSKNDRVLLPEAWEEDVLEARRDLRACGDKWWRFLSRRYRDAGRKLESLCREEAPKTDRERIRLLDAILDAGRLRREIDASNALVADLFPGLVLGDRANAHERFAEAAVWLVSLRRDIAAGLFGGADIHGLLEDMPDRQGMAAAADATERSRKALAGTLGALSGKMELRPDRLGPGNALEDRTCGDLDAWLRDARQRIRSAHDVVRFNQLEKKAAEAGIAEVAEAAASRPEAAAQLSDLFEHACYSAWLDAAFRERPVLSEFDGSTHGGIIERFRELDMAQFHHNRAAVAETHWRQLPRQHGGGQLGVLKREFQKKTRHKPVRRLMKEAGRAIQSIKPVFMMSPLSIAKYIPPESVEFDLVIFDEASQVRPVEALGAIIRGRQAVVVGDSKQLPPTSFFDRMGADGDEEGSQTADLESILGLFCAQGAPERMLRWHYRSRHESLITVSNHEFYDNRLVVFPSPDAGKADAGLAFRHHPEANYQRKGINADEARTVAKAVMEHARAKPGLTLGVAAFSVVQARRIEDEVDILRRRDPSCEEFFGGHPEEPFFVKNLENVQGDERDVILISIGYGKIDGAHLPMQFGPLNRDGGERRLNVLITRARRRCIVYCNFVGTDLDLRRSRARGVEALKTFLEYARTGVIDTPEASGREADSPFEEAVAGRLRERGHDVSHQVGSAGFFIDLAVVDPERPGRYLLGIECDGASYHSARSARDRDRLRQQVLEGLGWKIHRIWSTDWFRDPERELGRVEEAISSVRTAEVAGPPVPVSVSVPEPAKPLEREAHVEPEAAPPTSPYELAEVTLGQLWAPLHEIAPGRVAKWIGQVVEVESPVHLDEATARIRSAAGKGRSGSRIRNLMKRGANVGDFQRLFRLDSRGFLWRRGQKTAEVRRRDGDLPASLRNPAMIAPEEIATALLHVVRASYGIDASGAVKEAIRLFAFRRSGTKIVHRFTQVLDELVAKGKIERVGSILRVPESDA